jgi:hypothetical protein
VLFGDVDEEPLPVEGAARGVADDVGLGAAGEDEDGAGFAAGAGAETAAELGAVDAGETPVEDGDVAHLVLGGVPGGLGVGEGGDVVTAARQEIDDYVADAGVVFDDECSHVALPLGGSQ